MQRNYTLDIDESHWKLTYMTHLPIQESWFHHIHVYHNCMNISKIDKYIPIHLHESMDNVMDFPQCTRNPDLVLFCHFREIFDKVIKVFIRNQIFTDYSVECFWRTIISTIYFFKPFCFLYIGLHLLTLFWSMTILITIFTILVGFLSRIISTISCFIICFIITWIVSGSILTIESSFCSPVSIYRMSRTVL